MNHKSTTIRSILFIIFAVMLIIGIGALDRFFDGEVEAGTTDNIHGWAWSDNIGWISFNCTDTASCGIINYGVNVDKDGAGLFTGYAWSDNIGWISFSQSDLSGCPTTPCEARLSGNDLRGWARALAGGTSGSGGWDGFISLNDSNYGVTFNDPAFEGFAWGGEVVGWVDFKPSSGGVFLSEAPPQEPHCHHHHHHFHADDSTTLGSSCPPDTSHDHHHHHHFPQCADGIDNDGDGDIDLNDPGCTSLSDNTEASPLADLLLSADPTTVTSGNRSVIEWTALNATSCTVTGSNGDSWTGVSGSETTSQIREDVIYTLLCTDLENRSVESSITIGIRTLQFEEF